MRIIPAIDIINGKCVRLTKGDYRLKKVYNDNPVEVAKQFEDHGIKYLHLVDLDGAKSKHIVNHNILKEIKTKTNLKVDFGGGIKSDSDIEKAFENGADQVTAGSIALKNRELFVNWLKKYGPGKIILGADFKERKIATDGWMQNSEADVLEFCKEYQKEGVSYVVCTDISKDGMLQGPSLGVYKEILDNVSVNLIASGGISSIDDLKKVKAIGCEGAIIGKAIYEGKIKIKDIIELC